MVLRMLAIHEGYTHQERYVHRTFRNSYRSSYRKIAINIVIRNIVIEINIDIRTYNYRNRLRNMGVDKCKWNQDCYQELT